MLDKLEEIRVQRDVISLGQVSFLDSCSGLLPFRVREKISEVCGSPIKDFYRNMECVSNLKEVIVGLFNNNVINVYEYVYSAMLLSSQFSIYPPAVLSSAWIDEKGCVNISFRRSAKPIPCKVFIDFVKYINKISSKSCESCNSGDVYDKLLSAVVSVCGKWSERLNNIFNIINFCISGEDSVFGLARILCGCVSGRSSRSRELFSVLIPFSILRISCSNEIPSNVVVLGYDAAVMFNGVIGDSSVAVFSFLGRYGKEKKRRMFKRLVVFSRYGDDGSRPINASRAAVSSLVVNCSDPIVDAARNYEYGYLELYTLLERTRRHIHVIFPEVENVVLRLKARKCPVCGSRGYYSRCLRCGSFTQPDEERAIGLFNVSFSRDIRRLAKLAGISSRGLDVHGLDVFSSDLSSGVVVAEDLVKGVFRRVHGVSVYCDGTSRIRLGIAGGRSSCRLVLPINAARSLVNIARFVDSLAKYYGFSKVYGFEDVEDLVGEDVIVVKPGRSIGLLVKIDGLTEAPVGFSCDFLSSLRASVILLGDYLLNFSTSLLDNCGCGWGCPYALVRLETFDGDSLGDDSFCTDLGKRFLSIKASVGQDPLSVPSDVLRSLRVSINIFRRFLSEISSDEKDLMCKLLYERVLNVLKLYFSFGYLCRSCGRVFRRKTMSGVCPLCGGDLVPIAGSEYLDELRGITNLFNGVCSSDVVNSLIDEVESVSRSIKQTRLTDFV